MTKIIGKIGLTPKGDYDKTKSYEILDLVQHEGSSYVSLINNNLTDVTSDSWQLIAIKGSQGEKGIQGEKGNAFVYDDFTPEQLLSLKGDKGDTGAEGKQGERGIQGEQGEKGNNGENAKYLAFSDKTEFLNYIPKENETVFYYGVDE